MQTTGDQQRPITSCFSCRRRKVRCDHGYPVCTACSKGNHVCSYLPPTQAQWQVSSPRSSPAADKIAKPTTRKRNPQSSQAKIDARLARLEELLLQVQPAIRAQANIANSRHGSDLEGSDREDALADSRNGSNTPRGLASASMTSAGHTPVPLNGKQRNYISEDDTLLVQDGHTHFVSAQHWALLAEEFQDIKELLNATLMQNEKSSPESQNPATPPERSLIFGQGAAPEEIASTLPDTKEDCYYLLGIFFSNVDPMLRLLHRGMITRKFDQFVKRSIASKASESAIADGEHDVFDSLAMAIFFSAVNSMTPEEVTRNFRVSKRDLVERFKRGTELCLERDDFLSTDSLETLQAFVILLTAQCREDNVGKVWPLTGVAIRLGISQGLHRDPSHLPTDSLDVVQVELRRRLWAQICHLDYRSAEGLGHDPTITDDQFDTLMPSNIDDSSLVGGVSSIGSPTNSERFTDMTLHLVRLTGIQYLRRLIENTSRFVKRAKLHEHESEAGFNLAEEQQALFETMKSTAQEMNDKLQTMYLRHCDVRITMQRYTIELGTVLECKFWITFWLRLPREYREAVIAMDVRTSIFEKCVDLIEKLGTASLDKGCEPFYWHIASHSAFHAVLYVLSELRSPGFQHQNLAQSKDQGLKAVIRFRDIRGNDGDRLWNVITRLIGKFTSPIEASRPSIGNAVSDEQSRSGPTIRPQIENIFRGISDDTNGPASGSFDYMLDMTSINNAADLLSIGEADVENDTMNLDLSLWHLELLSTEPMSRNGWYEPSNG